MWKFYLLLFAIMGSVLFYVYVEDPCNQQIRTEFSSKYPDYKILDSISGEGTPENVLCHIYYEKPDSEEIYKDIWSYKNSESGWQMSGIIEAELPAPVQ